MCIVRLEHSKEEESIQESDVDFDSRIGCAMKLLSTVTSKSNVDHDCRTDEDFFYSTKGTSPNDLSSSKAMLTGGGSLFQLDTLRCLSVS